MEKKHHAYLNVGLFFTIILVIIAIEFVLFYDNEMGIFEKPSVSTILEKGKLIEDSSCTIDSDCSEFGENYFCAVNSCYFYQKEKSSKISFKENKDLDNPDLKEMGFFVDFVMGPVTNGIMKNIYYNEGNVGIGTSNPQNTLNVVGDVNITNNLTLGSLDSNSVFTQYYNNIIAPPPGKGANVVPGIHLINNAPATLSIPSKAQNSPSISFTANSWNPYSQKSESRTWSIHDWGFSTLGTGVGGVLTFTVERPNPVGDPITLSPVAFDEAGRVLLGYTSQTDPKHYGFSGEDFGQWGIILAGKTVVGWPENRGITSDFVVTGKTDLYGNLTVQRDIIAKDNLVSSGCFKLSNGKIVGGICNEEDILKKNVNNLQADLNKFMELNPITFELKGDPSNVQYKGFRVQDIEKIYPERVVIMEEFGIQKIIYSWDWIIDLIKITQEQQKQIDQLQKDVEYLKKAKYASS